MSNYGGGDNGRILRIDPAGRLIAVWCRWKPSHEFRVVPEDQPFETMIPSICRPLTMLPLLLLFIGVLRVSAAEEPPTEWIDPDTGHRIVRLSKEPGGSSLYFHQNPYTPDMKWLVFRSDMHGPSHVYAVEVAKAAPGR